MEWKDWIGKKIFVKLNDGAIFSESIVLDVDDVYISIRDKFGKQVFFKIENIVRIGEDFRE